MWTDTIMGARSTLLALPSKIASVVMAADTIHDVEDFARDKVYRALHELADSTNTHKVG